MKNPSRRSSANAAALVTMCKLLQDNSLSRRELSNKLGIRYETAAKWLKLLYNAKLIYIAEWKKLERGYPSSRYEWGSEKDATRPKPLKLAEHNRKYRAKKAGRLQEYQLMKKEN
jgi:predicted ArsR family transcriptional regulator